MLASTCICVFFAMILLHVYNLQSHVNFPQPPLPLLPAFLSVHVYQHMIDSSVASLMSLYNPLIQYSV